MRVNELAKELGKSSKEVLEILQKHNQDVKTHSSSVSEEQIGMVKRAVSSHKTETAVGQGAQTVRAAAAGTPAPAETRTVPAETKAAPAEAKPAAAAGEAPKKKIAAVYRPQNSQQRPQRPQGQPGARPAGQGGRPQGQPQASLGVRPKLQQTPAGGQGKPAVQTPAQPIAKLQKQAQPAMQQEKAPAAVQTAARVPVPAASQAGAQSPVPAVSQTGAAKSPSPAGAQAEAAKSPAQAGAAKSPSPAAAQTAAKPQQQAVQQTGSQTGSRSQSQPGTKPQGQQPASQSGTRAQGQSSGQTSRQQGQIQSGSRQQSSGPRQQGGQGSRDGRQSGQGYQSRDGRQGGQGYQNRDGRPGGQGYQGNRDTRPGQGYQGSRDGGRPQAGGQGFGGGRGGARPGQRDAGGKSYDTPLQTKPGSTRQNKNNYKNDRYDKKNITEDGPRSKGGRVSKHPFIMPQKSSEQKVEETVKMITLPESLTIKDLADRMKLQPSVIIKKLFLQGQIVTMNSEIDFEKAEEIAMEYDVLCEKEEKIDVIAELLKEDEEDEKDMISRPPVVCVMGHVDHGKTSLLDAIRSTNVTSREAGGITQHIGAYTVEINDHQITFLDTPGHEAFTAMRLRGAQSTDIAILVVAADDGVMPQTIEAINHAKAAGVEIIVAINKIDKPSANVDRVKQELSEYELIPEDWGGSTIFVPVSAHTKEGIPELLEMILLAAEVRELKANPDRKARGLVIEAELDKGKGPVATILVQKGTLRVGDNVTAGPCYGKVRAMMDDKGRRVKEAGPSMPVEVLGLNDVPGAGDVLVAVDNEKEARSYAETFIAEGKNKLLEDTRSKLSLDDLFSQIQAGNVKDLPIIVKADVQGSVEAVKQSLVKLSNEEVVVKVIHGGVGAINESDVTLASASNAIIIGFNVRPDVTAKSIAEREKVDVRLYRVIYQAIEDVEAAMKGMLDPVFEEQVIGHAVVRQTFKASGVGTIAGAYVMDGKFQRGCTCRVTRDGEQLFDGALASLRRFKDDVKEVATGYECGLVFEKFNDIMEDDMVEAYIMVEVPR